MEGVFDLNDKTEDMQAIRNIEDKYGLMLFGMGLTQLFDVGHQNVTDENVDKWIAQIKAEGKACIMTPEFKCAVIQCAAELGKFSPWALFAYIKEHVVVGTESGKYLLLNCYEREIGLPEIYDSLEEAQNAMKAALIEAMDGVDDSVFADYTEDDDYGLEPTTAWFNHRRGNHDWLILRQTRAGRFQYA